MANTHYWGPRMANNAGSGTEIASLFEVTTAVAWYFQSGV